MPPVSLVATVSLRELADLAIGTPEAGAVNFTALHTLIVAMLRSLHLLEERIPFQAPGADLQPRSPLPARPSISAPQLPGAKEKKRSLGRAAGPPALEGQVKDLGGQVHELSRQLRNMESQVQRIVAHVQHLTAQAAELGVDPREWLDDKDLTPLVIHRPHLGSVKVLKDAPEATGLLQDVLKDVKTLKEAHLKARASSEMIPQKVMERIEILEKFIKDRDQFLEQMGRKLSSISDGEDATMVTWEELEQAINDGWKSSRAASETLTGVSKHRGQIPIPSADRLQREPPPQHPSADISGSAVEKTLPPDLPEHLKSIKTLAKEVRQEKAKLDRLQRILEGEGLRETGKEMKAGQLSLQLGILRVTMADIEKELAELRESQERGKVTMEHSVSEASLYLQDQLDKLRTIIESMLASSSTLLTLSMPPSKTHPTLRPGQIDPEATCPACSLDLSHQVSTLVQRYEQLQDMVNNLAASRPSKKAKLQSQDEELLGRVQSAILQVQGDCERLAVTTSGLIADHRQKQRDINVLYQGLEKLEREKANREHLETEIDVKADKSALAAKVSRVQFDATTEQLNHMMRELVARMSGREQDWQTMLDKLLAAMDSKLDRLELEPVKQLLEDRWKSLRQQLKERSPLYQADEAAAMRRQLLAHFHCLSCDRPLETPLTGQVIPAMPVGPGLPGHRSTRPYTVFELEQVRQQSRNLKLGGPLPRGDLSQMERSVGRLRSAHSKMLTAIEKVQIHFGGSVKASSQMIHELLQAQCLGPPCYRRMTDMADYSYSSVPRRCGGSHTLTYPYRRNRLQHLSPGLLPAEETQAAMKHDEVDILGLDGHIYKGRMDTRLPGIVCKDTPGLAKHKAKQSRPHGHRQQSLSDNHQLLSRPQSAQLLAGNNPASLRQHKDRPVSSEVLLSQPNVAHPPSPTEMTTLTARNPPALNMHLDVPPREGLEDPTRGPRSNTAH
ncbi:glutamine-rich protein 2-like isoform X4 [Tamandua tetradactyla]|uniref:glutamine-rich protein 2-like isoform X4 n=1 Tax=Tamandua tetradactyla TaxID=48850 RepID=UPI00405389C5